MLKKLLFPLSLVLVIVIAGELLLRTVPLPDPFTPAAKRWHRYLPSWNHWVANPPAKQAPPLTCTFNPGPLIGVEPNLITFEINRYGFLYPEHLRERQDADEIRIAVVGGSTVECIALAAQRRWPNLMQATLAGHFPGRRVTVLNLGLSDQTAASHLAVVVQHAIKLEPDVLIIMLGINDLHRATENWEPLHSRKDFYRIAPPKTSPGWVMATRSQIGRRLYASVNPPRTRSLCQPAALRQEPYFEAVWRKKQRLPLLPHTPTFSDAALKDYETDIVTLGGVAAAHGIRILFVNQPTLWKAQMDHAETAVDWHGIYSYRGREYRLSAAMSARLLDGLNQHLKTACTREGFPFLDLAAKIPRTLGFFYDHIHFNEAGSQRVSEVISGELLRRRFF